VLNFLKKYNIEDNVIAVGVSGGADSLALVLWLNECLQPVGKKTIALTVNHRLRPESDEEADYVHQLMKKEGIEHHILLWEGDKPVTGIEEAAREARYRLLKNWCTEHQVRCLCVAHHLLDQAETFMMRLHRGSGLTGLCGMQEVSELNGLTILRPFLKKNPDELKAFLRQRDVQWITDSSNDCDDFLRVRIRKFLPQMQETIGITPQRLVETMSVLNQSREYIQNQVDKFIKNNVRFWDKIGICVSLSVLIRQHKEIIYHTLAELIKIIGEQVYTARAEDIERLADCMQQSDFKGATLGHCEVFVAQGKLWIVPELKLKNKMPKKVWDDFVTNNPRYNKVKLPYKLRVALVKTKMKVEF